MTQKSMSLEYEPSSKPLPTSTAGAVLELVEREVFGSLISHFFVQSCLFRYHVTDFEPKQEKLVNRDSFFHTYSGRRGFGAGRSRGAHASTPTAAPTLPNPSLSSPNSRAASEWA